MAILIKQITATQFFRGRYSDGSTVIRANERFTSNWVQGGAAGEAQQYYELSATATNSGTFFDLGPGGAGPIATDVFGASLGLVNVHAFFLRAITTTTGAGITLAGDFITTIFATATNILVHADGCVEWASEIGKDITAGGNTISYIRTGSVDTAFQAFVVGTVLEEA